MMSGKVYFVGAGPGDPELITLRGNALLEDADLVLYTGSLVSQEVLRYVKGETINSHGLNLDELTEIMVDAVRDNKKVVRLHTGDPSLYGAIYEQIVALKEKNIESEIVPGVSSLFAAAASLGVQLTLSGVTETLIATHLSVPGADPVITNAS